MHTLPQCPLLTARAVTCAMIALCMCACKHGDDSKQPHDAVAIAYDKVLTHKQLRAQMPTAAHAADSARLAHALINDWIETQLINEAANHELDMDNIENMVQEYRNELIAMEYSRLMYESHATKIPEDTLRAYYEANKEEFKLTRPMVKGVYIKTADDADNLAQMKRLYASHKEADIDRLDKLASTSAVHYDYFRDKWIDWEQIESRVPYDFGPTADSFLRSHRTVEYSQGGFTYLLDITDVLHPGQIMPYEAARSSILDRLTFIDRKAYNQRLKQNLYADALENGKITLFVDNE